MWNPNILLIAAFLSIFTSNYFFSSLASGFIHFQIASQFWVSFNHRFWIPFVERNWRLTAESFQVNDIRYEMLYSPSCCECKMKTCVNNTTGNLLPSTDQSPQGKYITLVLKTVWKLVNILNNLEDK